MKPRDMLRTQLQTLRLHTAANMVDPVADKAQKESWTGEAFACELLTHELEERRQLRIQRLAKAAHLPVGKTLAAFDQKRLPLRIQRQVPSLCAGEFVDRADNLLLFGLPGRGKTHFAAAIGDELVQHGRRVLFTPTYQVVARLLRAKRDLALDRELRRLDRFEVLILDDLGYVQQNREEMDVLFTLLAERYERRSLIITSNLVFSEWNQIFKDPLTTAAAIDRVVHHSLIIEFGKEISSRRAEEAARRQAASAA
jgi:DNA replication protein DnaC